MDQRLIIFVRAPRPGAVKTRLAAVLGPETAAAAYRRLVDAVVQQLAPISPVTLYFAPADAAAEISGWLQPGWQTRAQSGGNLGERMHAAFAEAFAAGANRVALIGSDCPSVNARDVETAWDRLSHADLVLGPALDGGYWLIALNQPQPGLFKNITWSSDAVLSETLSRAAELGLKTQLVRVLRDVDTPEDWQYFLDSTAAEPLLQPLSQPLSTGENER